MNLDSLSARALLSPAFWPYTLILIGIVKYTFDEREDHAKDPNHEKDSEKSGHASTFGGGSS